MAYDKEFFKRYEAYLEEPTVRRNHDLALEFFDQTAFDDKGEYHTSRVVDLGCGIGEFSEHGYWEKYVGVDRENRSVGGEDFLAGDYTEPGFFAKLPFVPNAFVSLFSIEACYPAARRYELYEQFFRENPELKRGLSAGFFYESARRQETVSETGEIVSYQTIEDISFHRSPVFDETRIIMRTPSTMFERHGRRDVVEVWKILTRK